MTSIMAKSKLNSFSHLQIKKSCCSLDRQISVMLLLKGRLPCGVDLLRVSEEAGLEVARRYAIARTFEQGFSRFAPV